MGWRGRHLGPGFLSNLDPGRRRRLQVAATVLAEARTGARRTPAAVWAQRPVEQPVAARTELRQGRVLRAAPWTTDVVGAGHHDVLPSCPVRAPEGDRRDFDWTSSTLRPARARDFPSRSSTLAHTGRPG